MEIIKETAIYPLTLPLHIIFGAITLVYLLIKILQYGKLYQITLFAAILITFLFRLIPFLTNNVATLLYFATGVVEIILVATTIVSLIYETKKFNKAELLEAEEESENKSDSTEITKN